MDNERLSASAELTCLQQQNRELKEQLQQCHAERGKQQTALELYRDLVELAADAILMGDPRGDIIGANQSAVTLTGYSRDELLGMNISCLFSAEEAARVPLRYDLLKEGRVLKMERQLSRKDGSTVAVEMNSKMMPDGTYHSFIRDISERKEAEEALRLSEEKFSRAFRLSPDAININRASDGLYLEINQGFTDLLGWTAEEVVGRSSNSQDLGIWCHSTDRERLIAALRETGEVREFKASFRHKDGRILIGLMSARIIEIEGEACVLSITRDITERIQMHERQKKLEEQMLQAQKLESLGVLAGGIAHDFNNILMAVLGHCELALRRVPPEQSAHRNLEQIKASANTAADLANQMLAYSGRGRFVIAPLNLSRLVEDMQPLLGVTISKKAVMHLRLADSLPSVEADRTQLHQVLLNLVMNASDAIGETPGEIVIETGTVECRNNELREISLNGTLQPGPYVYLQVTDTGCGMNEETQKRIFEPFFTTKFSGRGLGMAAVQGIVRGHRGAIQLESEVGQGTRIRLLLPASGQTVVAEEQKAPAVSLELSGRVLLVDDDAMVRSIGREMLEYLGFEVITAVDGFDAVKVFSEAPETFRFVLMDLTMPHMDGFEAMHELRRIAPQVKVVMCSGYNDQRLQIQGEQNKAPRLFLKKPFRMEELQSLIRDLL